MIYCYFPVARIHCTDVTVSLASRVLCFRVACRFFGFCTSPDELAQRQCKRLVVAGKLTSVKGWVAQLVEQRTENPRVGGSIPSPAISSS